MHGSYVGAALNQLFSILLYIIIYYYLYYIYFLYGIPPAYLRIMNINIIFISAFLSLHYRGVTIIRAVVQRRQTGNCAVTDQCAGQFVSAQVKKPSLCMTPVIYAIYARPLQSMRCAARAPSVSLFTEFLPITGELL